jgi:hypothetical protein
VIVIPLAIPNTCVCIDAAAADLHTSELLTTTDGALAVGGALSVTTVELTVLESALKAAVTIRGVANATASAANAIDKSNLYVILKIPHFTNLIK